ncbi:hypothetical protein BHE74_00045354 [Ensete ventricosum]|nr:hypothetical protein BHE74_00045354 [Ensete ventricosum]
MSRSTQNVLQRKEGRQSLGELNDESLPPSPLLSPFLDCSVRLSAAVFMSRVRFRSFFSSLLGFAQGKLEKLVVDASKGNSTASSLDISSGMFLPRGQVSFFVPFGIAECLKILIFL